MTERRKHRRRRVGARALVKSRWQLFDGLCLDASQAGFLLQGGTEFAIGDRVELALDLPDGRRIHCDGKVVREDPQPDRRSGQRGYGVRIVGIRQEDHATLKRWLRQPTLREVPAISIGSSEQ